MRTVVLWLLVAFQVLAALLSIGTIGKPRQPLAPLAAVITTVISGSIVVALLYVGGVL